MAKEKLTRDGVISGRSAKKKLGGEDRNAKANTARCSAHICYGGPEQSPGLTLKRIEISRSAVDGWVDSGQRTELGRFNVALEPFLRYNEKEEAHECFCWGMVLV